MRKKVDGRGGGGGLCPTGVWATLSLGDSVGCWPGEGCPSLRHRQFPSPPHRAGKMRLVPGRIVQGGEMPTLASPPRWLHLPWFSLPLLGPHPGLARAIHGHQGSPGPTYPIQGSTFSELVLNPFSPRLTDPCQWASQEGPHDCTDTSQQ